MDATILYPVLTVVALGLAVYGLFIHNPAQAHEACMPVDPVYHGKHMDGEICVSYTAEISGYSNKSEMLDRINLLKFEISRIDGFQLSTLVVGADAKQVGVTTAVIKGRISLQDGCNKQASESVYVVGVVTGQLENCVDFLSLAFVSR